MSAIPLPLEGACRCGRVRLSVSKPPLLTMACHCTGCQRMTSSAFSLSAAFPADGFEVTLGEPVIGGLHGEIPHYFCGHCMSWLFTRIPGVDWVVNVRVTMFDDVAWFTPFMETCTSEMLPWAKTPARHSFPLMPAPEDFMRLTQEYAASSG